MASYTPQTQKALYAEADARFWAQSGVKPGHHLDPHNPVDAPMIPVWQHIYDQVAHDYDAGILAWTYNHPAVQTSLGAASILAQEAANHLDAAASATTPEQAKASLASATAAHAASQAAAQTAAVMQPPTISPTLAAVASELAEQAAFRAGASIGARDAVTAIQAKAAPGMAMGVHTPGDPNQLHFTMQGGAQPVANDGGGGGGGGGGASDGGGGGGGGGAPSGGGYGKKIAIALGVVGGVLGIGVLVTSAAKRGGRSGGGGGRRRRSSSRSGGGALAPAVYAPTFAGGGARGGRS